MALLKNSPTATQADQEQDGDDNTPLDQGETYCSPQEEMLLHKVMGAVYHSINDPKKLRLIESWLLKAQDVAVTIGHIAFQILNTIHDGAKHAGVNLPPTVFLAQGGAVYQTIDRLMMIAEHCGAHADPDHTRETALGIVLDDIRRNYGNLSAPGSVSQRTQQQQQPEQPMLAAHPLSAGVQQGLMDQGMGTAQ